MVPRRGRGLLSAIPLSPEPLRDQRVLGLDGSQTRRRKYETIYANMPLFGLAAAMSHVRAEGGLSAARDRMRGG
jgi:hypothetical protein